MRHWMRSAAWIAVALAIFIAVGTAPQPVPVIGTALFFIFGPLISARTNPDGFWGLVLERRRGIVVYLALCGVVVAAIGAAAIHWLSVGLAIGVLMVSMLGWGLYVTITLGPDGMGKITKSTGGPK